MKTRRHLGGLALAAVALVGCGDGAAGADPPEIPSQCEAGGAGYVPFDAANYDNQALRVGAHREIVRALGAALDASPPDLAGVRAAFGAAREAYEQTAGLRDKVKGREDAHEGAPAGVGVALDAALMRWLALGEAAEDALTAKVAREAIDKTLLHFFYLSVYYELVAGQRAKWDEAFGYFGAPADHAVEGRGGLSAMATVRDGSDGTALEAEIFDGLVTGSCALAEALGERGAEALVWREVPGVRAAVEGIDGALQRALAAEAVDEATEMVVLQARFETAPSDVEASDGLWVKLAELDALFRPLEDLMLVAGGPSATRAEEIRAALDTGWEGWASRDTAWMDAFDAAGVGERLQLEYDVAGGG